jgi:hypothetical protein
MSLETSQKEQRNRRVERVSWATDVPPRDSWQRLLMEALGERGPLACAWAHETYAVDRGLGFIGLATRAIAHAIDALCGIGLALAFGAFVVLGTSRGADVSTGVPVLFGPGHRRAVCGWRSLSNGPPSSRPLQAGGGRPVGWGTGDGVLKDHA